MACLQERDLLSITFLVHVYMCAYMASTRAIREIMREILTSSVDDELVKTQKHQQAPRFHVVTMTVLRCWWLCFSRYLRPSLALGSHHRWQSSERTHAHTMQVSTVVAGQGQFGAYIYTKHCKAAETQMSCCTSCKTAD
jgi:hypothetical protein